MHSSQDPSFARNTPLLFGRLPARADFVQRGTSSAAERTLMIWIRQAVEQCGDVLPPHTLRFLIGRESELLAGVWLPSCDSFRRVYPLVLLTRMAAAARALPWQLHLASYAGWLAAAESCLMHAQRGQPEDGWRLACTLGPPAADELAALQAAAERALDEQPVRAFAARTLNPALDGGADFVRAIRSFRDAGAGLANRGPAPVLDLTARDEHDLFAWFSLIRAQLPAERTPHAIFWAPCRGRALVALDDPAPAILQPLVQSPRAANLRLVRTASEYERARDRAILLDRSLADLVRALAHGLTSLPARAIADMPPPLTCYTDPHAVLETK